MSKRPPLRVVVDIGGDGALAKIEKGKKIMRGTKSDWSQAKLPVSISLALAVRFSSLTLTGSDRNPFASREPIPFGLCVPGIHRPVDTTEPADDDEFRTCRLERQSAKVEQGERVRCNILLFFFPWV